MGAAFAVVGRRELGEIPFNAGRELVRLVVTDDVEVRLPPGALTTATRFDSEPLTQPRPLGARDQNDCDREQGDVQPAHAASLAERCRPRIQAEASASTFERR